MATTFVPFAVAPDATIDYATVDKNGLDELMRFGLYEPGEEPVHGVLIEPQQEQSGRDLSNANEKKPPTAFDDAVGDGDASSSRINHITALMTWIIDDTHTDDEANPKACHNKKGIRRSPSCSSDGSTIILYEGPRILSHVLDAGDIETLPDDEDDRTDVETLDDGDVITLDSDHSSDDEQSSQLFNREIEILDDTDDAGEIETLDGADIVTLDSESDFDGENGSERCYGEIETLDDTDDNSERMIDAALIGCQSDVAETASPMLDDADFVKRESTTVSNDSETTTSHDMKTGYTTCQTVGEHSIQTNETSDPKLPADETNQHDTDVPFAYENPSPNRRRRSRQDTRRTRDSAKKVSKLKKLTRMIKSCLPVWNK